jgi:uncharacterized spore protein YtfJ
VDVSEVLKRATDVARCERAFGPVIEQGDTIVVPVALVAGGGGGGGSSGNQLPEKAGAKTSSKAQWSGDAGGTGFGGVVYPLGVYKIHAGEVRWYPAYDLTRLTIAFLALFRPWMRWRSRRSSD